MCSFSPDPYGVFYAQPLLSQELATLGMTYYLITYGLSLLFFGTFTPFPISVVEQLAQPWFRAPKNQEDKPVVKAIKQL